MDKKKILILGASSDIGVMTVHKFIEKDWIVIAHYNQNAKKLKKINNTNLKLFKFDLRKINNFDKFVSNHKIFGNIDSFISLTGYLKPIDFLKINLKNLNDHINVNYLSNIIVMKKVLPIMKKRKFGRILLCSSVGVKFGGSQNSIIYSLTKHMNEFFFTSFKEFFKENVLINTIRIGVTDTKIHRKKGVKDLKKRINLIPMRRIAKPSEMAEYLYFYASEKNSFTTKSIIEATGGE